MTGRGAVSSTMRGVARLQSIYFFLALSGLAAALSGLYISQQALEGIQERQAQSPSLISGAEFDTSALTAPVIELLNLRVKGYANSKAIAEQRSVFEQQRLAYLKKLSVLGEGGNQSPLRQTVEDVSVMVQQLSQLGPRQDPPTPAQVLQVMSTLHDVNEHAEQATSEARLGAASAPHLSYAKFWVYEYAVSCVLTLILFGAGVYGVLVGRIWRKKFSELDKAHNDLEESHQQALAFSREIQVVNRDVGTLNVQLNENLTKLREAQDEALRKGKMAQLGNLTATVAHELRNPLGIVRTSAFLLGRKIKDRGVDIDVQLQRINNGIVRCDNIITQLLDFSRSRIIKPEPVKLDEWLAKIIEGEAQRLPEQLMIECHLGLGDLTVNIEPGRFERAVINLLSNASEALLGRGDDVRARYRKDPLVRIETRLTGQRVEITVADNGPGISPDNLEKIREPLFTTKNFGTGLGIPAIEQILDQHGGGLEITSQPGEGAQFTIWLSAHNGHHTEVAA